MFPPLRPWLRRFNHNAMQRTKPTEYEHRRAKYALTCRSHRRCFGQDATYGERRIIRPRIVGNDEDGWSVVADGVYYPADSREEAVSICMEWRKKDRRSIVRAGIHLKRLIARYKQGSAR